MSNADEASEADLVPTRTPADPPAVRADRVGPGPWTQPIKRVQAYFADEWEELVEEWAHSLKKRYHSVWRCSGAGDMGRDVVGHIDPPGKEGEWDNYQCKHYVAPLRPSDVWVELGKLMHYTHSGKYTPPKKYYFVSPRDAGTKLARLFEKPDDLRLELKQNWDRYCLNGIKSTETVLNSALLAHIESYDFTTITFLPVLKLIEEHSSTPWHVSRFGGGLPDRPVAPTPPPEIGKHELPYTSQLFKAYSEYKKSKVEEAILDKWADLQQHYLFSRASFYSAESLSQFSRDHLPEKEFDGLKGQIHDGIQETYLEQHSDGYAKVRAVAKAAINMQITDHSLLPVLRSADRRGICHQLVNDGHLLWVNEDADDSA